MYSISSEDLHTIHNQVMSTIGLIWMRQEKGQSVQNFRDQFTAMRHVCKQFGLTIGQLEQGAEAFLKKEGMINLTTEKLKVAKEKAVEEFFANIFYTWLTMRNMGKSLRIWKMKCYRKKTLFQTM